MTLPPNALTGEEAASALLAEYRAAMTTHDPLRSLEVLWRLQAVHAAMAPGLLADWGRAWLPSSLSRGQAEDVTQGWLRWLFYRKKARWRPGNMRQELEGASPQERAWVQAAVGLTAPRPDALGLLPPDANLWENAIKRALLLAIPTFPAEMQAAEDRVRTAGLMPTNGELQEAGLIGRGLYTLRWLAPVFFRGGVNAGSVTWQLEVTITYWVRRSGGGSGPASDMSEGYWAVRTRLGTGFADTNPAFETPRWIDRGYHGEPLLMIFEETIREPSRRDWTILPLSAWARDLKVPTLVEAGLPPQAGLSPEEQEVSLTTLRRLSLEAAAVKGGDYDYDSVCCDWRERSVMGWSTASLKSGRR
jgi:hypothetical protein